MNRMTSRRATIGARHKRASAASRSGTEVLERGCDNASGGPRVDAVAGRLSHRPLPWPEVGQDVHEREGQQPDAEEEDDRPRQLPPLDKLGNARALDDRHDDPLAQRYRVGSLL